MIKIKIVTDSTADLPSSIVEQYNIEVLPLSVHFGEESFRDGIDIDLHTLLQRVKEGDVFPSTSQVNPQSFYECYKKYTDEGYDIISLHLSSKMSGTYQSACIARNMLEGSNIAVIDSLNVTSGLGLLVMKAASLAQQGRSITDIEMQINEVIPHVKSVLVFDSLEHLVKGGRLSKTAGFIGNVLGIKPILAVNDGEIEVIDKVRGSKKAIKTILDYLDNLGIKQGEIISLLHVEGAEILDTLRSDLIEKRLKFVEFEVGCVVGTHAGPGACGIFFIEKF